MTAAESMTDEEFQIAVLDLVVKHLGVGAGARYTMLHLSGRGDYTRDRHLWLDGLTPEQIAAEMESAAQTKAA